MPTWFSRLLDVVLRRRRDARLDEEIATHLEALRADHERRGLSPGEAALAARRSFGGIDQTKAHVRDARGWPWLVSMAQDVRFALRYLTRDRAFSATLLSVLALGIGVSHLFFTLTYAHTMRGLPMPDVERVHAVWTIAPNGTEAGVSYPDVQDLQAADPFERVAAYAPAPVTVADDERAAERFDGVFTTADGFAIPRIAAVAGRVLTTADDRPGAPLAVVLTERVWRVRYQGDGDVIGRDVRIDGSPGTIVGVVSDASGFPSAAAVFLPLAAMPGLQTTTRDARSLRVFARLAASRTANDATNALLAVTASLAEAAPAETAAVRFVTAPINTRFFGGRILGWLPFITAGLIVVAVASANGGNLLMARARTRAREVAIRVSIGAAPGRIVRQLLVESVVVAVIAAACGLGLSRAGVVFYRSLIPDNAFPYWFDYSIDSTVIVALWMVTLATVTVFAIAPALVAARTPVVAVLKDGGRADTGRRGARLGSTAFLAVQVGLALVLVAQVGVAALTPRERLATDAVLDDRRVLTATLTLPTEPYGTVDRRRTVQARLMDRIRRSGAVVAAAFASGIPVEGSPEVGLEIQGQANSGDPARVFALDVSPDYFKVLGLGMVAGRGFGDRDGVTGDPVVVVNERLVALHFRDVAPLGRRIALRARGATGPCVWATVVGVVPDVRHREGRPAAVPIVYSPFAAAAPATAVLLVRTAADGAALTGAVRGAVRDVDANLPLYRVRTLATATRDATWVARMSAMLANMVCLSAFALSVFGLFAVASHRTLLRRREIGLRMAMGADAWRVGRLVVGNVAGAVGAGLALGLLGVLAWNRAFAPPAATGLSGPVGSVAAVVLALTATVLLGCVIPTWQTVRTVPAEALRRE